MVTGYLALVLIAVSLAIGPLNILRAVSNPPSINLRRDIGIIAGILAIAHVTLGLQVHFGGDFVRYFLDIKTNVGIAGIRVDGFGIANHLGLIATMIILVILCISNNLSIRRLGPRTWKRIQRWNYVGASLVVLHALLYQGVERRKAVFVAGVLIIATATASLQLVGFRRRRARST
jgi:sulfoxide reductase heme-binding subunit YedZ